MSEFRCCWSVRFCYLLPSSVAGSSETQFARLLESFPELQSLLPEPCRLSGFWGLTWARTRARLLNPLSHAHPRSQHRRLIFWEPRAVRCRPALSRPRSNAGRRHGLRGADGSGFKRISGQDAATNSYAQCVDSEVVSLPRRVCRCCFGIDLQSLNTLGVRAHNTAIEQEQALADKFNEQIRLYKARHPRS